MSASDCCVDYMQVYWSSTAACSSKLFCFASSGSIMLVLYTKYLQKCPRVAVPRGTFRSACRDRGANCKCCASAGRHNSVLCGRLHQQGFSWCGLSKAGDCSVLRSNVRAAAQARGGPKQLGALAVVMIAWRRVRAARPFESNCLSMQARGYVGEIAPVVGE